MMQKEAQAKYVEFMAKRDSLSEMVLKIKQDDLKLMNDRIQSYQQNAQQQMQTKQEEIFKPMLDKADKTIKEVGAEKGLIYVFNMDAQVIPVSYTHLRAHETRHDLVCRLLLEKKKKK